MEFTYQEADKTGAEAHQRTVGPADRIGNHGILHYNSSLASEKKKINIPEKKKLRCKCFFLNLLAESKIKICLNI